MSSYDVYIGSLGREKPLGQVFDWDDGDWNNNAPAYLSPGFPSLRSYGEPFFTVKEAIESDRWPGWKQTDWGTWAAKVTAVEIRAVVGELYDGVEIELPKKLTKLRDFIDTLEEDKLYALVAMET